MIKASRIGVISFLILFLPAHLLAANYFDKDNIILSDRDRAIAMALDSLQEREIVMEETLKKITIELAIEFGFPIYGNQQFELFNDYNSDGVQEKVSRLEYPHQGAMLIFKGEVGFLSKFFLGGRYASSDFRKKPCSDEDWNIWDPSWGYGSDEYIDYQISRQMCKSEVEFFDLNLYYRLIDFDENQVKERRLESKGDTIFDYLLVNRLSLDIFTGYQQQKGRYGMIDPMTEFLFYDEGTWYYLTGLPADIGLDSFYKICYKGPRLGLRAEGSKGKVTTRVRFAYAWLKTEAHGWWNLRELAYWQSGRNGSGVDMGFEVTYAFTPSLSIGMGFNYLANWQKELKLFAIEDGTPWPAGPTVKNADSQIYGPSFILKYNW